MALLNWSSAAPYKVRLINFGAQPGVGPIWKKGRKMACRLMLILLPLVPKCIQMHLVCYVFDAVGMHGQ